MKPIPLLATLLPIFLALPVHSAPRAGSKSTEWPAAPEHHTIRIQRDAGSEGDEKLIAAAEKSQPDPSALLEAMRKESADANPQPGQWWNKEVRGVRIPYAITDGAVEYYSDLVKGYGAQKLVRYAQPGSSFTYQAKVAKHASYEVDGKNLTNVFVVTLSLSFQQKFTATVADAFGFEKERVVVFDENGKVIHIRGDGDIRVPVLSM